jgi:hypothetical protein
MKKTLFMVGFGASLMYYFDPEMGEVRRGLLRDKVESLLPQTKDALSHKAEEVVAKVGEITEKADQVAAEKLQHLGEGQLNASQSGDNKSDANQPGAGPRGADQPKELGHS